VSSLNPAKLTARGLRTRTALLAAAEEVFGKNGYERASISEITRTAGVAQGTFYVYFSDKKTIFTELVTELRNQLGQSIRTALEGANSRLDVERAGLRAFFIFVRSHQDLYRIVRQAEFVDEELYRDYYRSMSASYAAGLKGAMQDGEIITMDAEVLAYSLMGLTDFLGMRFLLWEDAQDIDLLVEQAMTFITRGLRAST